MSSESKNDRGSKPRSAIIAALLELLAAGLGHLYAGRLELAAAWFAVSLFGYGMMALLVSVLGVDIVTITAWTLQTWVIKAAALVSAVLVARKTAHNFELKTYNRWWAYLLWFILVVSSVTFARSLLRSHVIEAFKFPSASMEPALLAGDHVMVDKTLDGDFLQRPGALVAFRFPAEAASSYIADKPPDATPCIDRSTLSNDDQRMIKRVVASAGDEVTIRDAQLSINGVIKSESLGPHVDDFGPYRVPENHVFVMGDNAGNSSDSRCWGPVPTEHLEGRVEAVWWSVSRDGVRWDRLGKKLE